MQSNETQKEVKKVALPPKASDNDPSLLLKSIKELFSINFLQPQLLSF